MNDTLIDRFIQLISRHAGLSFREQDRAGLAKKLIGRIRLLKLSSPEDYYQLLASSTTQSPWPVAGQRDSSGLFLQGKPEEMPGAREWKKLLSLLTTGESYFFRDSGQIWLLKNLILPQLINHQRLMWYDGRVEKPRLQIWSAGASTGEEAYSLAILVRELIPDWESWQILILGTDINREAIAKAKLGTYGDWSFRTMSPQQKNAYFNLDKGEWKIKDDISRLVTFSYGNLVAGKFPNAADGIEQMDLILCRNVFVYFTWEAIALVLQKFYKALRPGGYLMTAHAELHGQNLDNFETIVLPQSVFYQRKKLTLGKQNSTERSLGLPLSRQARAPFNPLDRPPTSQTKADSLLSPRPSAKKNSSSTNTSFVPLSSPPPVSGISLSGTPIVPSPVAPAPSGSSNKNAGYLGLDQNRNPGNVGKQRPEETQALKDAISPSSLERNSQEKTVRPLLDMATTLFQKKAYPEAIEKAREVIKLHPNYLDAYCLLANIYANLGYYQQAEYYCDLAIKLNYRHIDTYYLLARISEEKGDIETAKSYLKRIIYLSPISINAYLELASIYEKEGDDRRAQKMRFNALEILEKLPDNMPLENNGEITTSQLKIYLNKLLKSK